MGSPFWLILTRNTQTQSFMQVFEEGPKAFEIINRKIQTHFQVRKLPKQVAQIVTVSSTWQNHDFTASFECVQIFPRIQFRIYRKTIQNSHKNFTDEHFS